ncbi:hypothetical protein [Streptomyces sp. t39]|uniref:hypothetical protein n=1 Tax=Streptomyces sp. t39 TaxID=1828156 RepID=UPI0011CDDC5B|nr:hypothetical protein [Streptomyces sp. t39]TXS56487.1 hypothetical protein EAO77_10450 [Streptomyces sp. t39]
MSRRDQLPPPPPPEGSRAWPHRYALLADRARALEELHRRSIGVSVLAGLWALAGGFAAGWVLFAVALRVYVEGVDPLSVLFAGVLAVLGVGFMVPTGLLIGFGLARDGRVRRRLRAWSALDADPPRDAAYVTPGLGLTWLLPSFVLCACGLWLSFVVPATARRGEDTLPGVVLLMGLGAIAWLTGLIGTAKAVAHYRWALRLLPRAVRPDAAAPGH